LKEIHTKNPLAIEYRKATSIGSQNCYFSFAKEPYKNRALIFSKTKKRPSDLGSL